MDYLLKTEEETKRLAKQIIPFLSTGDIIALQGDLGAGKTTFTKALARELSVEVEITSPTFVILKSYPLNQNLLPDNLKTVREFVHVDCYRFAGASDAFSVGLDEYFMKENIIMVVEWAEKIKDILPIKTKIIKFDYISETQRKANVGWIKK